MGAVSAPVRRRILAGAFVAGIALTLLAPVAAYAANNASFSSRIPASGARLTAARPALSVTVYDRYGAHGSGAYSMTLDGKAVTLSATYLVTGSWNPSHPNYTRFRLTARVTRDLAPGTHKVSVKVHDLRNKNSTSSWSFVVKGPQPPQPPYHATFSLPVPAKGSSALTVRPSISLTAYDKWGVRGAGSATMTIDGTPVTPALSYTKSGVCTALKVVYRVPSDLRVGTHVVNVGITDLKAISSSYAWTFTVLEPPLVPMPVTGTSCAGCHVDYLTAHPMTNCVACHGPNSPPRADGTRMDVYYPGDLSAHTLACATSSCHRGGGTFPHVIGSDCARCHNGSYAGIPAAHTLATESLHQSSSRFCIRSGCHVASLTVEHYRRTVNGVKLSCATCHGSTDPAVRAAIDTKSTACEGCHDFGSISHPGTTTAHIVSGSCIRSSCHPTNVAEIHHGKCDACHAPNKTASTTCADCHSLSDIHSSATAKHTPAASGCVSANCHGTDVALIHQNDCSRCHNDTITPSTVCANCHHGDVLTLHPSVGTAHTAPTSTCVNTGCHVTDVTAIHSAGIDPPGCAACHADGKTPSVVCATCHQGDLGAVHKNAATAHAAPTSTCVTSTCHLRDVTAIHGAGVNPPGCAACHAPGTTPSLVCATCHAGSIDTIHAVAGTSHVAPVVTCVSSTCHESSITTIHGKPGGPGCAACHAPGVTASSACAFCHSGDITTIHAKADPKHVVPSTMCVTACHTGNVAAIHAAGPGCVACHDGIKTLTTSCAACHPQDIPTIHISAAGFHIASTGTCVTPGCHASNVVTLHSAGTNPPGCPACHAPGKTPSVLCGDCHQGDVTSLHASATVAHTSGLTGVSCIGSSCHASNVSTVHAAGPGCSACHGEGLTPLTLCTTCHTKTMAELHTRGSTSHTGWNPSCITARCHNVNVSVIHDAPNHDGSAGPSCAACHRNPAHAASLLCADCHTGASAPKHAWTASLHTSPASTCVTATCHPSDVVAIHTADYPDGRTGPACAACHADDKTPSVTCSDCHGSDPVVAHAPGNRPHTAPAGYCIQGGCHVPNVVTLHTAGADAPGCAACHAPGAVLTVACAACHSTDSRVVHAAGTPTHVSTSGLCVTSGCHARSVVAIHGPTACYRCHADGVTPSVVCADCHTKTPATLHAAVPGLETSHTASGGVCVNRFCHLTNVAAIHDPSTSQCAACHADGATPSKVCTTCHTADPFVLHNTAAAMHVVPSTDDTGCVNPGCHGPDVVALHSAGANAPGCAACHDPSKTPSLQCSSCHGSDTAVVHRPGDATHNTANVTCIKTGCHGGNVVTLHSAGASAPGCGACHDNPNHALSVDCITCHPGADTQAIHAPYIGTRHDPLANVCNQPGCHLGSVVGIHAKGPSCAACHSNPDHGPTLDCSVCHAPATLPTRHASEVTTHTAGVGTCTPGDSGCHAANVMTIHATDYPNGTPGPGCAACHAAGKTPSLVCSTCHVGGFTIAHPAPAAAHTVTGTIDTECVKSGCHGAVVVTIHFAEWPGHTVPGCTACHATGKTPSLVCANCHFATLADHTVPTLPHTAAANDCTPCHGDQVATIHVKNSVRQCQACHANPDHTPTTVCTTCHTSGTYHANAAASHNVSTSGCTGTATGCHPTDVSVTHTPTTKSCQNCHASGQTPTTACLTCHPTHHTNASAKHAVTASGCSTGGCHATDVSAIHVKNSVSQCQACHAAGKTPSTTCASCHAGGADHTASHPDCNSCHPGLEHGSGPVIGTGDCYSCHNQGGSWTHPDEGCHGCQDPAGWTWNGLW
jgi:hypothetical protein